MLPLPTSLTIRQIKTTVFRLPMYGALRWGRHGHMDEVRHVLVEVTLSDGSAGVAEAPPRPTIYGETAASITGIIRDEIAPRLLHCPTAEAAARMEAVAFNFAAKGAIDMALHDAFAQSRGVGLVEHLGARPDANLRVSYILGIGSRDEVLAEAESVVAQGVRVLKVKVGRDLGDDLARIDELMKTLGSDVQLYADANECLDANDAAHTLARLRERGLLYCEEPLPIEMVRERAALRARRLLPLIADDSAFTPRDLRRELALETFDILNIKTARTGYTQSAAMLAQALGAGRGVMVGSQASAGLGAARAGLFAALGGIDHPSELTFFLKVKEDIADRQIPIRDGCIAVADLTAVRVEPAQLRALRVDAP